MTKEHLTTLWKWLCLGCFAYVVGSVITIQGGIDIFGAKFLADVKRDGLAAVGYFSAIVGSALMNLELVVVILFSVRHGQTQCSAPVSNAVERLWLSRPGTIWVAEISKCANRSGTTATETG